MKRIECPECGHRFTPEDVKRLYCKYCKRWRRVQSFYTSCRSKCKECQGTAKGFYKKATERRFGLKWCAGCRRWRHPSFFSREKERRDGLQGWCRNCNTRFVRERRRRLHEEQKRITL